MGRLTLGPQATCLGTELINTLASGGQTDPPPTTCDAAVWDQGEWALESSFRAAGLAGALIRGRGLSERDTFPNSYKDVWEASGILGSRCVHQRTLRSPRPHLGTCTHIDVSLGYESETLSEEGPHGTCVGRESLPKCHLLRGASLGAQTLSYAASAGLPALHLPSRAKASSYLCISPTFPASS